jgi:potassium channel
VIRLQEEFFLPGEVILEQGSAVDQLYFVCHGALVSSHEKPTAALL